MQLGPLAWALTLTVSTIGGTASPASHPTLPPPIPTRQTVFSIPFQIDRVAHPANAPVEIRLYVSADRGASWQIYDRVAPEQGHFLFRAPADGPYWFILRTLDRSGQLRPQRVDGPGLCVLVDTALPQLQLDAQQEEAGQITLEWQAADPYLDLDSLNIQYRSGPMQPWRTVAVDRQRIRTSGATRSGEVTWWPESASKLVEIRAEVADAAGNLAVSHAQVDLNGQTLADFSPAIAPGREGDPGPSGLAEAPASQWRPSSDPLPAPAQQSDLPSVIPTPYDTRTADNQPDRSFASERDRPDARADSQYARSADPDPLYPEAGYAGARYESRNRAADPNAWSPEGALAANASPPIQSQYVGPEQRNDGTSGFALPTAERPQTVNTRLFELEYHLDEVGLSGVGGVELWGTRDGGRTWTSYGIDQDNQSPILVAVEQEGLYGFRIAVQSRVGFGSQNPQSGDRPDVWICVDLTKPNVQILSAEPGTGDQAGQLIIRWQAADQMLAAGPVSLSFSESRGGPWTAIASGLENTGEYCSPVDARVPRQIYLRLDVRDEAGNVGTFETPQAVAIDPFRPAARIRGVRPVVDRARTSSRPYPFMNQ
jgi:hypothetical protein